VLSPSLKGPNNWSQYREKWLQLFHGAQEEHEKEWPWQIGAVSEYEELTIIVHHTIILPTALSLPLLQDAAVGRAPTIFQNDWFFTRISNFFQSPFFSIARDHIAQEILPSLVLLVQWAQRGAAHP